MGGMTLRKAPAAVSPDDLVLRTHTGPGGILLPYRLWVPRDYVQSTRYPVLLFLHGMGERGDDNLRQLENGVLAFCAPDLQKRAPTFVVYPQCPKSDTWARAPVDGTAPKEAMTPALAAAFGLLETLAKEFSLSPSARLVGGLSMGGYGTWELLCSHPGAFAGAMPICGGGDPARIGAAKNVPVWAFHGAKDDAVPVGASRAMVKALRRAGGRVRYTEYSDVGHASWEPALADKKALRWLLARGRQRAGRN